MYIIKLFAISFRISRVHNRVSDWTTISSAVQLFNSRTTNIFICRTFIRKTLYMHRLRIIFIIRRRRCRCRLCTKTVPLRFTWCRLIAVRRVSFAACIFVLSSRWPASSHSLMFFHHFPSCCRFHSYASASPYLVWFVGCGGVCRFYQSTWKYENKRQITIHQPTHRTRNPIEFNHKYYEYFSLFIDLCFCVRFVFRATRIMADCIAELMLGIRTHVVFVTFAICEHRITQMCSQRRWYVLQFSCIMCARWASWVSEWYANCEHEWRTKNTANEFRAMEYATFIGRRTESNTKPCTKMLPFFFLLLLLPLLIAVVYSFILLLRPK